ncbi:type II toxin-antitoxin system HigA family antitoxin [Chitinophaga sp. CF418]|uniref:helix-turn-helix domain-containing protein n=1 Tax=Chitinophaga sp. CF418 TaxID=1855287 RepID=UPI0009224830|nr:XRE family transcriptional regulator [Chitinophaga sp. CF418]SHN45488.1 HTH-type transcriptional regulator / antitoxin HigA [Chitinophaga sp. CF418]
MSDNQKWYLLINGAEYDQAAKRYEEVKRAPKGTLEHREKLLLAHLISYYENKTISLPELDPIELIKIRMDEMGMKPADLAKLYGNKGNISKVLNYHRSLSIDMIRLFSEKLRIPAELLIKDYPLKSETE